mmetsp:Transcript_129541/g.288798  ORF Transcript_129541/g.288798 Transcript_129541/m.288798 type:complete len:606 (-) Transcript_129541:52-1869(-)
MDSLQLRTGESSMVVPGAAMPSTRAVLVSACGQLFEMPPTVLSSMTLLLQDLAGQLKMSSSVGLQLADAGGVPIRTDSELSAVLREGRHPMRVTPTVAALREIEQKKFEVETKKEQMTQFQWQIVVDQIAAFSTELAGVAAQLQSVKDECLKSVQGCREEARLQRDQIGAAIEREALAREGSYKDVDSKVDKLAQVVSHEKSVRDVADHQLGRQIEQVASALDEERNARTHEFAESSRLVVGIRHDLDAEMKRSAETWNQHLDMVKRLDLQMEAHTAGQFEQQQRLTKLEADTDKLQGMTAGLDASLAAHHRSVSEDLQRRGDELSKAVRDEMLSRENHVNRFAKDLETSWQSMEARMHHIREDTSEVKAALTERARVMEHRCTELEQRFQCFSDTQTSKDHLLTEKVAAACSVVDTVEVGQKASDVLLHNTVSQMQDLMDRLRTAEGDLQNKAPRDYWTPQIEAFQRGVQRQETKLATLEKEMHARFYQESAQRDKSKAQIQESMKVCMDKMAGYPKHGGGDRRPIGAAEDGADLRQNCSSVQVTTVPPPSLPLGHVVRQVSAAPGQTSPRVLPSPLMTSTPRMHGPFHNTIIATSAATHSAGE